MQVSRMACEQYTIHIMTKINTRYLGTRDRRIITLLWRWLTQISSKILLITLLEFSLNMCFYMVNSSIVYFHFIFNILKKLSYWANKCFFWHFSMIWEGFGWFVLTRMWQIPFSAGVFTTSIYLKNDHPYKNLKMCNDYINLYSQSRCGGEIFLEGVEHVKRCELDS